jgi:hypothetical protein
LVAVLVLAGPAGAESRTVAVPGRHVWIDTGFSLTAGSNLAMTAQGKIVFRAKRPPHLPATAAGRGCPSSVNRPFQAPNLPCYSLIAKIGDSGAPFAVGTHYVAPALATGELFLGPNDNFYSDNRGEWIVKLSAGRAATTTTSSTTVAPTTTAPPTSPKGGSTTPNMPSGALAFTGLGPTEQVLACAGLALVLVGIALRLWGDRAMNLARRLIGR